MQGRRTQSVMSIVWHSHIRALNFLKVFFPPVVKGMLLTIAPIAWAGDLIVTNARLIDGTGAEPVDGVNIVVFNDRVVSVTRGKVSAKGTEVIDAKGRTVMPGIIDTHNHTSLNFRAPEGQLGQVFLQIPEPKWGAFSDDKMQAYSDKDLRKYYRDFIESGVTNIVDAGGVFPWIIDIRERVKSGGIHGPNLYVAGRFFTSSWGHPASSVCQGQAWCLENMTIATDDPEVAREGVRFLVKGGVNGVKMVYDGPRDDGPAHPFADPGDHLKKEVMEAIIDEAHKLGVKAVAHTFTPADTMEVVKAGVDGLVHSTFRQDESYQTPDGEYLPALLNRFDVPMTTTLNFADDIGDWPDDIPDETREWVANMLAQIGPSLRAMSDAGVTLMFGTDFIGWNENSMPRNFLLEEARSLVRNGFTELEVIQMSTGNGAKHPFTPESIGTIRPGSFADIIVLEDDPLKRIEAMFEPIVVIQRGKIVVDKR